MLSLHVLFLHAMCLNIRKECQRYCPLQVKTMQQSNQVLRTLLNQYLASAVNDELQVPPTQIL